MVSRVSLSWLLLVVPCAWLYAPVVVKLVHDWANDDNYSHGFLVVPLALYFAWERREKLAQAASRPSVLGLAAIVAALALVIVGRLGAELFLTRISLIVMTAGAILFLHGWKHLRILAFPILLL